MLTLKTQKIIAIAVLILAVSCAPLLAKPHGSKHRRSEPARTKIEHAPQGFSKETRNPKANIRKSGREQRKVALRRSSNAPPRKISPKQGQSRKRIQQKNDNVTFKKPMHNSEKKALRPTRRSKNIRKAPSHSTPVKRSVEVVKAKRSNRELAPRKKPQQPATAPTRRIDPKVRIHRAKRPEENINKAPGKSKAIVKKHKNKLQPNRRRIAPIVKVRKKLPVPDKAEQITTNPDRRERPGEPSSPTQQQNKKNRRIKPEPAGEEIRHLKARNKKHRIRTENRIRAENRNRHVDARLSHRRRWCRNDRPSRVVFHERSNIARHVPRHHHVFRNRRGRMCRRIIWPRYRFAVRYRCGPRFTFRYVYPYYHRKYVFVSLGGYWPIGYTYARYYWYGWHPYYWYGYYPVAREVTSDTYNYYTYNYYYADGTPAATAEDIGYVDHTTFEDVREKLEQQDQQEPSAETQADKLFEEAVKAFEAGDYDKAAEKLAEAIELEPDDMILPFAYAQALFADEKYTQAAETLRSALAKVPAEKEGVFYPRGLYAEDDTLSKQIDHLADQIELYSFDGDLQLLLGYQLLGVGRFDEALQPLQQAGLDAENAEAAKILLELLEKIGTENDEDVN